MNERGKIIIEAIEKEIRTTEILFEKAAKHDNYTRMASLDSYRSGLQIALGIVKAGTKYLMEESNESKRTLKRKS